MKTSLNIAGEIDFKITGGLGLKFDFGASFFCGIKGHLGGDLMYNINTKDLDWKSTGIRAKKEADLKAEMENIVFRKLRVNLSFEDTMVVNSKMRLACSDADIEWGKIKIFA